MKRFASILVLLLCALEIGCKSSVVEPSIPPTITGRVSLYNVDQDAPYPQSDGVTATLLGTPLSAVSGPDGTFAILNVPPGVYHLVLTKPGFDTARVGQIVYSGVGVDFITPSIAIRMLDQTHRLVQLAQIRLDIKDTNIYKEYWKDTAIARLDADSNIIGYDTQSVFRRGWVLDKDTSYMLTGSVTDAAAVSGTHVLIGVDSSVPPVKIGQDENWSEIQGAQPLWNGNSFSISLKPIRFFQVFDGHFPPHFFIAVATDIHKFKTAFSNIVQAR